MRTKWSAYYPGNLNPADLTTTSTFYSRLMQVCELYQDRTAFEYMGSKMSYADLAKTVTRTAVMWKNLGVTTGDRVLLCMGECPDMIFSVYALDSLGAAAVLAIPGSSTEHFEQLANNTGVKYCLMSFNQFENYSRSISDTNIRSVVIGKYSDYITGFARYTFKLNPLSSYDAGVPAFRKKNDDFRVVTWREAMLASEDAVHAGITADQHYMRPCVMLETESETDGGTASVFNAAMLGTTANTASFVLHDGEKRLMRPSRVLCLNEICFSFGFSVGMNDVLISGQTLILFTLYDVKRDMQAIVRYRPDTVIGYSGTIAGLNERIASRSSMKSVSMIICGGGLLTSPQKAELFTRSGKNERELRICTLTGCDEIGVFAYTPEDTTSDKMLGIPLPGIFMKVVDSETGEDMPEGRTGEIAVCSPAFYSGKLRNSRLVAGSLRHLPDGRDWFFTGLVGKMDDKGFFSLLNRPGRVYKIDSIPVYPAQVDRVIAMVSGVVDVCSVVIEDVSGPKLVAAVIPSEELLFDNGLMADLKERITKECLMMLHEAMCPSEVEFFMSLPTDSTGNKDFEAIRKRIEEGHNSAGN